MKKLVVIILILICNASLSQTFENSNWNDSKMTVIKANSNAYWLEEFSGRINSISELITKTGKFYAHNCMVTYYFLDNKLLMGTYIFMTEHAEYDDYYKDYKKLKKHLRKKHGKPSKKGSVWNNTCIQGKTSDGQLIAYGNVSHYIEFNEGEVYLEITGNNGIIITTLVYVSPNFNNIIETKYTYNGN